MRRDQSLRFIRCVANDRHRRCVDVCCVCVCVDILIRKSRCCCRRRHRSSSSKPTEYKPPDHLFAFESRVRMRKCECAGCASMVSVSVWLCPCILRAASVVCRCHYHIRSWSIMHTAFVPEPRCVEPKETTNHKMIKWTTTKYNVHVWTWTRHRQSVDSLVVSVLSRLTRVVVQLIRSILIDAPQPSICPRQRKSQLKKVTFVIVCGGRGCRGCRPLCSLSFSSANCS